MTQRRWIPGHWQTGAGNGYGMRLADGAATGNLSEAASLLRELYLTRNPEAVPDGLMELNGDSLVEFLRKELERAKEQHGAVGEQMLNGAGAVRKNPGLMTDAETEFLAGNTLADRKRVSIAKDIAKRRGLRLADVLPNVPK